LELRNNAFILTTIQILSQRQCRNVTAVVGTLAPEMVSEKAALFFFFCAAPKARYSKRSETHGASKSTKAELNKQVDSPYSCCATKPYATLKASSPSKWDLASAAVARNARDKRQEKAG